MNIRAYASWDSFSHSPVGKYAGRVPWKLFDLIFNITSELLKFPKQRGISPSNLLFDTSRRLRYIRLQIDSSMGPVKLLSEAENEIMVEDAFGSGSGPFRVLKERSMSCKLSQGRCSKPPESELCERSIFDISAKF